jgi:hypothetical protein
LVHKWIYTWRFWSATRVRRTQLDLFSETFELKQKAELVQISIQTQIDTVGERTDALSSAPGESAFRQTID